MDLRCLDLGVEVAGPGLRAHRCHSVQHVRGMKSNDGLGPERLGGFLKEPQKRWEGPYSDPGRIQQVDPLRGLL